MKVSTDFAEFVEIVDDWEIVHNEDYSSQLNKHFVASSIKDLFDTIEAHKIIDFIKETRFYKQL